MKKELVLNELRKVIYGKDEVLEKVLLCILARGNVLLEDMPGVGKTTMAKAFSKVFDMQYKRMQFTSDTMPSDVTGFMRYNKETGKLELDKGPIFTNMFLADEINRTSPKTQSALLEVMEEHQVTIDGQSYEMEEPFFVIATQNPYGSAGTNMLPQAQMDRFLMALSVGYPTKEAEIGILKSRQTVDPLELVKSVVAKKELLETRKAINEIHVDDSIYGYIVDLVNKTRNHDMIDIGCSPRGELAIMRLAKAKAYLSGREFVIPDDVSDIFIDACVHRIVLRSRDLCCISNARKSVLTSVLNSVQKPTIRKHRG